MSVPHINQNDFQSHVIDKKGVVFVDFYAEWCGPCKMVAPTIDKLADDSKYKDVSFFKINVDENSELSSQYNVFSIPTFVIFKDGKPVHQFSGVKDFNGFGSELDKILAE